MYNVPRVKYAMRRYADAHGIDKPHVTWASPVWGNGAKALAWRITTHAHKTPSTRLDQTLVEIVLPVSFGTKVIRAAAGEVGVMEHPAGSNDGPRVSEYQAVTGAFRQPWCASFVSWCYRQAGYHGPLPASPGWVPSWSSAARHHVPAAFQAVNKLTLRKGDYVTLWGNRHIELFNHWIVPGVLMACIGGNTAVTGRNSNGGAVCRTRRTVSEVTTAGRIRG